mmetsp:Transcript_20508/g.31337  ORF Transcript_20508/g.31337 Transcript_20508/m.31337 type:complete len:223 (+) Transcript_20508:203-871(+)
MTETYNLGKLDLNGDDQEVAIPSMEDIVGANTSDAEQSQEDDYKPISVPKVKMFDVSSFQQYANTINGNLGGKSSSSSDDDDDSDSKSDEKSVKSQSSDDSSVDIDEAPSKFLAFHAIQKAGGPDRRSHMKRNQSITLNSLARGNSSRNLGEDSVADITTVLTMKQEMSKQGVRFSDEVDEKDISKLRQSCINLMFYKSEEFAAFKYEAFMEECGLDPDEYE